jgi:hypothetical protein
MQELGLTISTDRHIVSCMVRIPSTRHFAERHTYSSSSRRFMLVSLKLLEADGLYYDTKAAAYLIMRTLNCEINRL